MTRTEFYENYYSWEMVVEFADYNDVEHSYYSPTQFNDAVKDHVAEMCRDTRNDYTYIQDYLNDLPSYDYDYYEKDECGDWSGCGDSELDRFKDDIVEYLGDDFFDFEDMDDFEDECVCEANDYSSRYAIERAERENANSDIVFVDGIEFAKLFHIA